MSPVGDLSLFLPLPVVVDRGGDANDVGGGRRSVEILGFFLFSLCCLSGVYVSPVDDLSLFLPLPVVVGRGGDAYEVGGGFEVSSVFCSTQPWLFGALMFQW